jgi:hypothetical protein
MRTRLLAGLAVIVLPFAATSAARLRLDQVKEQIIRESIARYPGPRACPYSSMRNGRRCGGRSAYSRGGGYAPVCYAEDVTPAMVDQWREANPGR